MAIQSQASLAYTPQTNTTANMKAWMTLWYDIFATAGWVQTADTGQVAHTTYSATPTSNVVAGYHVFRMADALQGTAPVFVKVEYVTAGSTPALYVTVGTGTDGAAGITGQKSSRLYAQMTTSSSAGQQAIAAGSTAWIAASGSETNNSFSMTLIIERSRDGTGADTGTGVYVLLATSSSTYANQQYVPFTGNIFAPGLPNIFLPSTSATTYASGLDFAVFPVLPYGGGVYAPCLGLMTYFGADQAASQTIPVTMFGTAHNYRTTAISIGNLTTNTGHRIALRYE